MTSGERKPPSRDEVARLAQMLGTPIDFDALCKAGILRRRTKFTYELLDKSRLPEYVSRQAIGMKTGPKGKGVVLMFKATGKQAQKTYEKLTGKKFTRVED